VAAFKIENITWIGKPEINGEEWTMYPSEALVEIHESYCDEKNIQSIIHEVLESYTNIPAESFDFSIVMKSGPVLKYYKQREDSLAFSGPLW